MRRVWWMLSLALWVAPAQVLAQPRGERARLQSQAEDAYRRGRHAQALEFAQQAGALGMTPQLRLFIAVQHEALGHLLDAVDSAERCVREAEASVDVAQREVIVGRCRQLVEALDARVARVVVRPPSPLPDGFRVRLQGAELDASRWGTPVPVLPGAVRIDASLGGGVSLRRDLELAAGAREDLRLELPAPAAPPTVATPPPSPPRAVAQGPLVSSPHVVAAPPPVVTPPTERPRPLVAPWIVAGAGALLLGAGGVLIVARDAAADERDGACPSTGCSATAARTATALDDDARTLQTAAYVTMGVGAAALAGGVVWWVISNRSRGRSQGALWSPSLAADSQGALFGVSGRF